MVETHRSTFNDMGHYQAEASHTAIYPPEFSKFYTLLGLSGEVGELCNKFKKTLRDGTNLTNQDVEAELGDILWYVAMVAHDFGVDLDVVAAKNISKLRSRQQRGVLGGSGDNR